MAWTWLRQQQQRGAQLPPSKGSRWAGGGAPAEAVAGREAQDSDYADLQVSGGEPRSDIDYPASDLFEVHGDIAPSAPDLPDVQWDDVVQPAQHSRQVPSAGDQPLPEGK